MHMYLFVFWGCWLLPEGPLEFAICTHVQPQKHKKRAVFRMEANLENHVLAFKKKKKKKKTLFLRKRMFFISLSHFKCNPV